MDLFIESVERSFNKTWIAIEAKKTRVRTDEGTTWYVETTLQIQFLDPVAEALDGDESKISQVFENFLYLRDCVDEEYLAYWEFLDDKGQKERHWPTSFDYYD